MCPRTCALGLSSSLLSENKKKTTKVCEIGDRESFFGALFILWIHGKNSHIRTTCKLGGHDLANSKDLFETTFLDKDKKKHPKNTQKQFSKKMSKDVFQKGKNAPKKIITKEQFFSFAQQKAPF